MSFSNRPILVALVLNEVSQLESIIDAWEEAGASGATILDCAGKHQIKEALQKDDAPIFPSLVNLLRFDQVPQKLIFSVVQGGPAAGPIVDRIIDATEQITGDLYEDGKGLLFVLPLDFVLGLRPRSTPITF